MKRRNPPALAVWLLNRLGVSAGNEPLTGDLLEEFRSGRTAGWYWRQTLMAIVAAFVQRVSELRPGASGPDHRMGCPDSLLVDA